MPTYWTEAASGPVFQIRVPSDLAPHLPFARLGISLEHGPRLALRRRATALASAAHQVFEEMRAMSEADLKRMSRSELAERVGKLCGQTLAVADQVRDKWRRDGENPDPELDDEHRMLIAQSDEAQRRLLSSAAEFLSRSPAILPWDQQVTNAVTRCLVTMYRLHDEGRHLIDERADGALERLLHAAWTDPRLKRIMGGRHQPGDLSQDTSQVTTSEPAPQRPSMTPGVPLPSAGAAEPAHLVSQAFAYYAEDLAQRKGADAEYARNLALRATQFHALIGDPDVRTITTEDLKEFAYAISYLPARVARDGSWNRDNLLSILERNGFVDRRQPESRGRKSIVCEPTISEKTLKEKMLGPIETAIRQYAGGKGLLLKLQRFRLHLPSHTPRAKARSKPEASVVDAILQRGFEDGRLVQAIVPLLGTLSGRRLSLLANLRCEWFVERNKHWLTSVKRHFFENGELKLLPIKTEESGQEFVLHDFLSEIGFIDFVRGKGKGWVFESLHLPGIKDPSNTVQKRLAHITSSGKERCATGSKKSNDAVFHQLRHFVIGEGRQAGLPRDIRLRQVGQAAANAHDLYANQWEGREIEVVATLPLPSGIDWERFKAIDFAEAEKRCIAEATKHQRSR